jgi:RNA polymerase sigma-70 factor (ECF subfamily)
LVRVRNAADAEAWRQFVELYAPLVYGLARKRGLQDADAADVTQEVFRLVSDGVKRLEYDPRRGTFRSWLHAVTRNCLHDFLERRARRCQGTGDSGTQVLLEAQPDRGPDEDLWEGEYRQQVFSWAVGQVRPLFKESTWQAFWQLAVEGKSGEETAQALGMTVGAVYVAKNRVLARLRERIIELEGA